MSSKAPCYEEVTYEGYGPGGAAIFIEATTDNANRTVAEIRHAFSRNGGNLGATNSVAWMFDRKGQIYLDAARYERGQGRSRRRWRPARRTSPGEGEQYIVTTTPASFHAVQDALRAAGFEILESPSSAMVPKNTVKVEGADAERILRLMEVLEELDDVSKVFSNFDIDAATAGRGVDLRIRRHEGAGHRPGHRASLGYGVVERGPGHRPAARVRRRSGRRPATRSPRRLRVIHEGLAELIARHQPDVLAVESDLLRPERPDHRRRWAMPAA